MIILGIETSCDETAVAVVEDGNIIKSNLISSQIKAHKRYGGVVPELASRMHAEKINSLIQKACEQADITLPDIDAIAVTEGPGLEGALLIGQAAAKTLSLTLGKPLIHVNHLWGHIYASMLATPRPQFPFICMLISGGHTQLLLIKNHFDATLLGQTRDDAVGESFDKISRRLGLGYPGGPIIEEEAKSGDPLKFTFPKAMLNIGLEFSFSGLKTAVIQEIMTLEKSGESIPVPDICASFQYTVAEIIQHKCLRASKENNCNTIVLSGGVSANQYLRQALEDMAAKNNLTVITPPLAYCTDNAAMIAVAAHYYHTHISTTHSQNFTVKPNLKVT